VKSAMYTPPMPDRMAGLRGNTEARVLTSLVFRRQITVEFGHCDPTGAVHVSRFFQYFDTNTWLLFETATGVAERDFTATFGILPLVDVSAGIRTPVRFGDVIEITSRVTEFRRSSFHVEHRITAGGELAVEGGETRVWAVRHKEDPSKISAQSIPEAVIARFA
jgi:4-hydroxybenzoyl-CoA thioesterase